MTQETKKLTTVHGHGSVRRLQTQSTIQAPIQTVWTALTDIEHVRQWWSDGAIGVRAGEPVRLGEPEGIDGTIVAMMAPHVFEFTWHDRPEASSHPEWIEKCTKSLVRFDLVEVDTDVTLLTLVQFAPLEGAVGASAGWHQIFEAFAAYVETGSVQDAPDRFEELKALYK